MNPNRAPEAIIGSFSTGWGLLGNSGEAVKARRKVGSTTSTMRMADPTTVIIAATCSAAFGANASPGAADRKLTTETIMVSQTEYR